MASKEQIQIILDAQLKNSQKTIEAVKKLEKNIKGADKSIKQAEKSTKFFSTTLGKLTGALGIAYLTNAFKNFGKSIIFTRGEMERQEIAFEVMLGSAEKAKNLLNELSDVAETSPFGIMGITDTARQLKSYGIETENLVETIKRLGDVATGVNVPISRIGLVYGQVRTKGRLMGDDLRQFSEAGVPLLDELAKAFGKSTLEITEMKEQGEITFSMVEKALINMTSKGGQFYKMMDRGNDTVLGQFDEFGDVITRTMMALGKPFESVIKNTTKKAITYFRNLKETIEENEDAIREWAEGFMEGVLTAFDVLKRFGSYAVDFFSNSFVQAVGVALVSWKAFSSAMTLSLGGITKALALVGGAIAYINSKIESGIEDTFKSVSDTAKSLKGTYDQLKSSFGGALGFSVENKTTTTTAEVSTKTTKEQKKKTGQDEKAKEKKLKNDLLAIDKDYNTKRLNQQAKSVEKQNELNQLASWGYYDEAEKKVEAKELELSSLKEANDLELEQQKEKLDLLREIKGEDNELVLEQEAEFRLMKAEQQAEFDELEAEYKAEKDAQEEERRKKEAHLRSRAHFEETKDKNKQLLLNKWRENKAFAFADDMSKQFASLAESKNKKLKAIGKAAAITQIGIDTALGAMSIFKSTTALYGAFLGPAAIPVALAAAGLVVAQGAEQIATVNSYAVGSPNIEQDQLANIHKGEIIVPKTFSDGLRDGDLMLGNAKSLDNQQTDEQRGGITIISNFEGANFYGVADKDEMIKEVSEAISENIADGIIQPFPNEQE